MNLEQEFRQDIVSFMRNRVILMPNNIITGINNVSMSPNGNNSCILTNGGSLNADCLQPLPNNRNMYQLGNTNYFFTSVMNGCQLVIYRLANGTIWVEHHNDIAGGGAAYPGFLAAVNALHPAIMYKFTPNVEYNPQTGLLVVGVREAHCWKFYCRDRLDLLQGNISGVTI